jgi:hypothetical protein
MYWPIKWAYCACMRARATFNGRGRLRFLAFLHCDAAENQVSERHIEFVKAFKWLLIRRIRELGFRRVAFLAHEVY